MGPRCESNRPVPDLVDQTEGAAVGVVGDDHVVAGRERAQDGVLGGQPAGEGEPVSAPSSEARLASSAARVGLPLTGVVEALMLADRLLARRWWPGEMGGTTAPVIGSGSWPAWMARVSKLGSSGCDHRLLASAVEVADRPNVPSRSDRVSDPDRVAGVEHEHGAGPSASRAAASSTGSPLRSSAAADP